MKILLIAPNESSFIKQDFYNLRELHRTTWITCWDFIEVFNAIFKVSQNDICFFWFASIRFLPVFIVAKLLGKKTVVIAGGYDVSCLPEAKYGGIQPGSFISFCRKIFLKLADRVITVSDSNTKEAITNAGLEEKNVQRIYLGFEKPKIELKSWFERKNQVVFIACCDHTSYRIKGFEVFLDLARLMPDIQFIHFGKILVEEFQKACYELPNVKTLGFVQNMSPMFSDILNDSKIILLPSKIESFGASIVEGGLHGCYPITSDRFALPEITENIGKTCALRKIQDFVDAISDTIKSQIDTQEIQARFIDKFETKKRVKNLDQLINNIK